MSYIFEDTTEYRTIKTHYDCKWWPEEVKRTPMGIDIKSWRYLYTLCVNDKFSLDKKTRKSETLNNISISNKTPHILTCRNSHNGESFTVSAYLCDIDYDITIKKYRHYLGFSDNINTIESYNHSSKVHNQLGFSVADILKYYYYTHKDVENNGFSLDTSASEVKQLWNIVKNSITHGTNLNNIPLGTCEIIEKSRWSSNLKTIIKLWDIKNHKVKWDYDHFFNSIILMDFEHLIHPLCAKNLLYLYVYGSNNAITTLTVNEFDEPMSLIKVIEEFENKKDHMVVYVKNRINNKIKKTEMEQLEQYPKLILDRGFMTSRGDTGYSYNKIKLLINRDDHKMMTYPLFAFRNIYVQDWIPGESLKILNSIIEGKISEQKNIKLKYYTQKKGKYISFSTTPNAFSDRCYQSAYDKKEYYKHISKRTLHTIERRDRDEFNEAIRIEREDKL